MDIKSNITFEVKIEDRTYKMEMPVGAPLGEAYGAASQFMDKIIELINDHAAKQKAKEDEPSEEKDESSASE